MVNGEFLMVNERIPLTIQQFNNGRKIDRFTYSN